MKLLLAICFGFQLTLVAAVKFGVQDSQVLTRKNDPEEAVDGLLIGAAQQSSSELSRLLDKAEQQLAAGSTDSQVQDGSANASAKKGCQDHVCSAGWVPKLDHHQLETSSNKDKDSDCCLKTCEMYVKQTGCVKGFVANPAYFRNVASSSQMCCDRTCQDDFQCTEYGYRSRGPDAPGHSVPQCCGATCSIYECPTDWKSISNSTVTFSDELTTCCNKTCKLFECSEGTGNKEDLLDDTTSFTQEHCCIDQCEKFVGKCPSGFGVPFANNDSLGNIDTCCKEECKHYNCSFGYDTNLSKALHFGDNDDHCCEKTCVLHTCEDMFADSTSPAKLGSYNITDESCCEASCKAHACSDGWLLNEEVAAEAGNTDEKCCNITCFIAACPTGFRTRPNGLINSSLAESDDFCCEPEQCATFDNLTALKNKQCSDLDQDECEGMYLIDNHTNSTPLMQCLWHAVGSSSIKTCRTWGTPVYDCTYAM